jgi:hypothetical protein
VTTQAALLLPACKAMVFGHFHGGTDVRLGVDGWIAAQRLNRLAQAAVSDGDLGYSVRPLRGHTKMSGLLLLTRCTSREV